MGNEAGSSEGARSPIAAQVLTNAPRNATVVCAAPACRVHEIKKRDFLAVLRRNKQTDHAVRELLNERARS